ncbi:MAG: ParB/RepB/Spo0J family partition protein [Fidelibacterota bacterium]
MTARKLGRGLSALIRETTDETAGPDSILQIPVSLIAPNPHQPRQKFDEDSLHELAESIKAKGIIQPITVRAGEDNYELIVGERRLRAARLAGLTEVPAHILNVESDSEMMEFALIENIQRENLNIMEEAEAYAVLASKYKMSHTAIAQAVGKGRVVISNTLRLLKLPPEIRMSLRTDEITAGHARALLALKDSRAMIKMWKYIVSHGPSVRTTEEMVGRILSGAIKGKQRAKKRKNASLQRIEDELISLLGTKVVIKPKSKGGSIEIEYYSDDDLDRLLELLSDLNS